MGESPLTMPIRDLKLTLRGKIEKIARNLQLGWKRAILIPVSIEELWQLYQNIRSGSDDES
jgi:hypothetical protein